MVVMRRTHPRDYHHPPAVPKSALGMQHQDRQGCGMVM